MTPPRHILLFAYVDILVKSPSDNFARFLEFSVSGVFFQGIRHHPPAKNPGISGTLR
jgi:hypothetical protein